MMAQTTQNDYRECQRVMRCASLDYTFASLFLPKNKLPHIEALYALLRIGDDRVDLPPKYFPSNRAAIEDWQQSYIHAFEQGDSPYPVLRAYLNTARLFDIPQEIMQPYFQAMTGDLSVKRYATFQDLLNYVEGSALVVGRAMCHILGTHTARVSDAYPAADILATAMQLSNFWRDVGEDWQRSRRIYLPLEDMEYFSYTEEDIAASRIDQRLVNLLEFEFERTYKYYEAARQCINLLRSGRLGIMSSIEIYSAIMEEIRNHHYDVFHRRNSTPAWRKLFLVAKSWNQVRRLM